MRKLLNKIGENSFFRSVLTVTSGTAVSQLVVILVSPLITRLYSPNDMGVLASYTAIAGILGTVIAGCYNQAVVLPETKRQTNAVVFLGILIAAIGCGLITVVTIMFDDTLINVLNLRSIQKNWFYLLGIFVFFIGTDSVLNQYAIKNAHFKLIATTQVTQQIATNGLKVLLGFCKFGTFGLLASMLLGQIIRVIRLFVTEFKNLFGTKDDIPSKDDIRYVMGRYKKFPLISSWSALLNTASVQLPVILFSSIFSPAIAGYYSLSHRILSIPISLIGTSVGNVFLERAAKSQNNLVDLRRITIDVYKHLLLLGSIIFSFVVFYGDILFSFVFGSDWREAGRFAQWIAIWLVFSLCYSPISILYNITEKQLENLIFQIFLFFSRISVVFIVPAYNDVEVILPIFCLISTVLYLLGTLRLFQILKVSFFSIVKVFLCNCVSVFAIQFLIFALIKFFIT